MKNKFKVNVWQGPDKVVQEQMLDSIFVRYKRKKYKVSDLLEFFAEEIEVLENNQCNPNTACLFLLEEELYYKSINAMVEIEAEMAALRCCPEEEEDDKRD